jgi:hypothetical protein
MNTKNGRTSNHDQRLVDREMSLNVSLNKPVFEAPSRKIIQRHNQTITVQEDGGEPVPTGFMMASTNILFSAGMGIEKLEIPGLQDNGIIDLNSFSNTLAIVMMSAMIDKGLDLTTLKLSTSSSENFNGLNIDIGTLQPDGTCLVDQLQVDDYQDEYAQRTGIINIPVKIRMNLSSVIYIPFSLDDKETLSVLAKFENADVYTR